MYARGPIRASGPTGRGRGSPAGRGGRAAACARSRATLGPLRRLAARMIRGRQEPVRDYMPMIAGATQVHPNEPARRDERAVVAPAFEVLVRSVAALLPLVHRASTSLGPSSIRAGIFSIKSGGGRGGSGGCAYCVLRGVGLAATTFRSNPGRTRKRACHYAPDPCGIDAACHRRASRAHGSGADWSSTGGLLRWGTVAQSRATLYVEAGSSSGPQFP